MHWAFQIAEKLLIKHPDKNIFTCAAGISPSGSVHVGNFREVLTTFFVVKALESLGKKTRFIFSWDDFDRLRKVPSNIPNSYTTYIGYPYSEAPNPFGEGSYACHFEKELERSLQEFEIKPAFIYQTKEYQSGRYAPYILTALKRRKEIYDILVKFKSNDPSDAERDAFFPISLYCNACRKDSTAIKSFHDHFIEYECSCGQRGKQDILKSRNIKLNWKVDWAMRWMAEDVVFEPGGRDHSSATGSYNVSKIIAKEIFHFDAPEYIPYEFIGIKGTNQKMSSSSGNVVTPKELLKVYTPEVILFMFAKYKPNAAFNIGFDDEVIRNFSEYERYQSAYAKGSLHDKSIQQALELCNGKIKNAPSFSQIAGLFPLINFNSSALQRSLHEIGEQYSMEDIKVIGKRAEYWIQKWNRHRLIKVNAEKNNKYYSSLTDNQKVKVRKLLNIIINEKSYGDSFMSKVYAICRQDDKKAMKDCQKDLFKHLYQLVINKDSGPRLPLLISAVGKERIRELLHFSEEL